MRRGAQSSRAAHPMKGYRDAPESGCWRTVARRLSRRGGRCYSRRCSRTGRTIAGCARAPSERDPYGGGVAELLRSVVPLLNDLGVIADWKVIGGDEAFFQVTKAIHNGLQGSLRDLTVEQQRTYLAHAKENAAQLTEEYDFIFIHDAQPAALLSLHGKGSASWIWRCHIDTSQPNPAVWQFLQPFLAGSYEALGAAGSGTLRAKLPLP
jgi:trehalose synthase-like protein